MVFLLGDDQAFLGEDVWDDLTLTLRTTKWDEGTTELGILPATLVRRNTPPLIG